VGVANRLIHTGANTLGYRWRTLNLYLSAL
jgi:hypothetical protein